MIKVVVETDDKIRTDMYSARWHFYKDGKEVHLDDLSLAEKQGLRIGCNTIVYDIENGLDYMEEIENFSRDLDEGCD